MQGELVAVPALSTPESHPVPKTVVAKLLAAIKEVPVIPKRGVNAFSNYAYATAEDITNTVRLILANHGLLVYTSLRERTSESIKTSQGKEAWREAITMRFIVTDGEGEITFDVPAEGQDTGDKAIYKAITGALKYGFRLLLHLPFGDDPEADSNDTARSQKVPTKPQPALVMPTPPLMAAPPPAAQPPANASMATERQAKAIHSLAKAVGISEQYLTEKILLPRFNVNDPAGLSRSQASQLLDQLKAEQGRSAHPSP